ncbi:hypothetical protein BJ170DRAFT_387409 [Xylariales sp. AK1849]|nr:hypothetical protein BJ170DRAFT_387409 [Xylariales sp. AK1849]
MNRQRQYLFAFGHAAFLMAIPLNTQLPQRSVSSGSSRRPPFSPSRLGDRAKLGIRRGSSGNILNSFLAPSQIDRVLSADTQSLRSDLPDDAHASVCVKTCRRIRRSGEQYAPSYWPSRSLGRQHLLDRMEAYLESLSACVWDTMSSGSKARFPDHRRLV